MNREPHTYGSIHKGAEVQIVVQGTGQSPSQAEHQLAGWEIIRRTLDGRVLIVPLSGCRVGSGAAQELPFMSADADAVCGQDARVTGEEAVQKFRGDLS